MLPACSSCSAGLVYTEDEEEEEEESTRKMKIQVGFSDWARAPKQTDVSRCSTRWLGVQQKVLSHDSPTLQQRGAPINPSLTLLPPPTPPSVALLALILVFFLCLPSSPSPNIALAPSLRVYISCSRLLHGAPEFILQPVVMARFLDQSWQLLVVDS